MKVIIATSPTGGHFFPALSFADTFNQKIKSEIIFVMPVKKTLRNFEKYPYKFEFLNYSFTSRKFSFKKIINFFKMIFAFFKSYKILKNFKPDFVLSFGGYGALPICLLSYFLKIPFFIYEPNFYPGLVNRLTAPLSKAFFAGFAETKNYLKNCDFFEVGIIVRPEFYGVKNKSFLLEIGFDPRQPVFLVFGGSQGASSLNELVLKILAERENFPFNLWQIIHATGHYDYEKVKKISNNLKVKNYYCAPFFENFWDFLKSVDLVICRAGASTVGEVIVTQTPAIFVPFPYASDNHQYFNALAMVKNESAFLIRDDKLLYQNIKSIMEKITREPQVLKTIKENLRDRQKKEPVLKMLEIILNYLKN